MLFVEIEMLRIWYEKSELADIQTSVKSIVI